MPRYITLGNFTIDDVVLPDGTSMSRQCGGDCLYAAMGIRLWCRDVGIVSVVGANYPQAWLDTLAANEIDITGIKRSPLPEGMGGVMIYDPRGERTFRPPDPPMNASQAEIQAIEVQKWYDFSPRGKDIPASYLNAQSAHIAPMPIVRQTDCMRALHGHVRMISLDLPWWSSAQKRGEYPDLVLPRVVLLSEFELAGYFGDVSVEEGVERLVAQGARLIVIKLGEQGSVVHDAESGQWWRVPIFPTQAQDPTGAGDAYCGGFLVGLDETGDPLEAALYGTVSASFIIEEFGALYSLQFSRADGQARLAQMRAAVKAGA